MRFPAAVLRPLAAVLIVSTLGCYSYVPLEDGGPEAGQEVRVRVGEAVGEPARSYRGRILQVNPETVVLSQAMARSPGEQGGVADGQVVRIERSRIEDVERQEVSVWKSAGIIAAGGAAATLGLAALAGEFRTDTGGGSGDDRDRGEAAITIPLPW